MDNYNKIDDIIRNYLQTEDICLSDDFDDNVMSLCLNYQLKKKKRFNLFKNIAITSIVVLVIILMLFTPINSFLIYLLGKITLIGLFKYYVFMTIITTIFFYSILFKLIVYKINYSEVL
jgi:hypothetical protein